MHVILVTSLFSQNVGFGGNALCSGCRAELWHSSSATLAKARFVRNKHVGGDLCGAIYETGSLANK